MVVRLAALAALLFLAACSGGGAAARSSVIPGEKDALRAGPDAAARAWFGGTFDVRSFGARCDGTTDDERAIQRAEQVAAVIGTVHRPAVVVLPRGTCGIGGPIAWDSNVSLVGEGMRETTLSALPGFTYDPAEVRPGPDGRQLGMIWLDGPTATTPIQNVTIANVGFDPRSGTQHWTDLSGIRIYNCIEGYLRPVQNLRIEHVYFELGANPTPDYITSGNEGPKAFVGVQLEDLGVDPLTPSHDLVFNDVHAHNGVGMLRFGLGGTTKNGVTSSFYDLTVTNEYDTIDLNYIEDDRLEIDGETAPYAKPLTDAPLGDVRHLVFQNINVAVAPSVVAASVNALRVNSAYNTEMHDITIDGVHYAGSPHGYGPLAYGAMHDGTGSVVSMNGSDVQGYINDVVIENVTAKNTIGVGVTIGAPPGQPLSARVRNVTVHDAFVYGGIAFTFMTPAPAVRQTGQPYDVTMEDVAVDGAPSNALNPAATPIGISIHRHLATGGDQHVLLRKVTASGDFTTALQIDPGFDGMQFDDVHWSGKVVIASKVAETASGPL